nr:hypothetical protein DGKKSRWO_DGKKSRWO_CDS_0138 [uncultured phage]CAI9752315.1 hypothetical protein CVNMHQAP_CVNMHQAP_CDS_0138 [uncultured phage]
MSGFVKLSFAPDCLSAIKITCVAPNKQKGGMLNVL